MFLNNIPLIYRCGSGRVPDTDNLQGIYGDHMGTLTGITEKSYWTLGIRIQHCSQVAVPKVINEPINQYFLQTTHTLAITHFAQHPIIPYRALWEVDASE